MTQANPSSRTDSYVARTFDRQIPETDSATNYSPRTIVRVNRPVNSNVTAVISVSKSSYFQPSNSPKIRPLSPTVGETCLFSTGKRSHSWMPIAAIYSLVGRSSTWDNRRDNRKVQKSARNAHNRHKINGLVDVDYFRRSQTLYPAELRDRSRSARQNPQKQVRLACMNRALIHEVEAIEVSF